MFLFKRLAVGATALVMVAVPVEASNHARSASLTINLRAYVPVLCRVQLNLAQASPDENGMVDLGDATEFCNSPRGYKVYLQHPAGLEDAAVIVGGVRTPLSVDGDTVLTDSYGPNLRRLRLAMDLGEDPTKFTSVGVRIEAK